MRTEYDKCIHPEILKFWKEKHIGFYTTIINNNIFFIARHTNLVLAECSKVTGIIKYHSNSITEDAGHYKISEAEYLGKIEELKLKKLSDILDYCCNSSITSNNSYESTTKDNNKYIIKRSFDGGDKISKCFDAAHKCDPTRSQFKLIIDFDKKTATIRRYAKDIYDIEYNNNEIEYTFEKDYDKILNAIIETTASIIKTSKIKAPLVRQMEMERTNKIRSLVDQDLYKLFGITHFNSKIENTDNKSNNAAKTIDNENSDEYIGKEISEYVDKYINEDVAASTEDTTISSEEFANIEKDLATLGKKIQAAKKKEEGVNKNIKSLQQNFNDAAYRVAATQANKAVVFSIVNTLRAQGTEEGKLSSAASFLDTEYGSALVSLLLGSALHYIPSINNDPRVEKLAEELRIGGMAMAGNEFAGEVAKHIIPGIMNIVNNMDDISQNVHLEKITSTPSIVQDIGIVEIEEEQKQLSQNFKQ